MSTPVLSAEARARLTRGLARDFVDTLSNELGGGDERYAEGIALGGFAGFRAMSDAQLLAEAAGKGLDQLLPCAPEITP